MTNGEFKQEKDKTNAMKIILFDRLDKLVTMFKSMAGKVATEKSEYAINRVMKIKHDS